MGMHEPRWVGGRAVEDMWPGQLPAVGAKLWFAECKTGTSSIADGSFNVRNFVLLICVMRIGWSP